MPRRRDNRRNKKKNKQFTQRKPENSDTREKPKPSAHRLRNTMILVICSLMILAACAVWISWTSPQQTQDNLPSASQQAQNGTTPNVPKAAILDGLYDKAPNTTLTEGMIQYLSNAGYTVDVYRGTNVTIDLLRRIGGYNILIMRLHTSIHTDNFLYVFSGEQYTESKYVDEQLAGAVREVYTFDESEPPYFALNSVFIGKIYPNGLNGTTLIMMGCNGTATNYVVQRFFQEGVQTYISWNGYVDLHYSDEATLKLIKAMCTEGLSPDAAVEKTNGEIGSDPSYGSQLICKLP